MSLSSSQTPHQARLHLHLISMHTSPLAQPGSGDAGGMNVYIDRSLRAMLKDFPNLSVEVFTLLPQKPSRKCQQISDRAILHFVHLPQAVGARKEDLPAFVEDFAAEVKRLARREPDAIHSHYWLSGLAALAYAGSVPVVHTMHTTAAAKDARAAAGEAKEPAARYAGEELLVEKVSALVVNTELEKQQMIDFYCADAEKIYVIEPGVDTGIFTPCSSEPAQNEGSAQRAHLVFAGRPQPLKGPHILVEALGLLPQDLQVSLEIIGKSGGSYEAELLERAAELGLAERVKLTEPLSARQLAAAFRRSDIVACPSSSETFGLVALEAQASGTPVLASDADGLKSAVADGVSGLLVSPRTPQAWAGSIEKLVRNPDLRARLGRQARQRALTKRWADTAAALFSLYSSITTR